ncbi:DNA primase [Chlamydia psittaci]|uniref:DNA primase n=1 Tax=Chlamydia psittaci TaxID=83554 RepID=UPI00027E1BC9|nr:DNA primase [Chlamydia psittaci]AFS21688.1 DNA primase [Chlamydia psittaci MN]KPZ38891.1 DNA primase [Chlamydia psittaci str. Frances]CCO02310.1 putative DNA primase [Chlamydia psittaci 01DC12]
MYTEESLDNLRHSIDIIEVLSEHLHLKRSGGTYKACCPFHVEKTPSFIVNPTGAYYHCFGCGAHGDAISFLMNHLGYSFSEAVLTLSKKFHVDLVIKIKDTQSPFATGAKDELRRINAEAEKLFRFCLYQLAEGREALQYLYRRGFSPDTIGRFHLGYAPEQTLFVHAMREKGISEKQLEDAGFIGNKWFLFSRRIIFPIHDSLGHTLGFSSRKFLENTRGSKYVNTPETMIFKKSRALFGLHLSRRRIAKEKRVILVEGQVDCLQMIDSGFNCTLAAQGTSFTEDHVKELSKLGVLKAYLLFDGDDAGIKAAVRVGDMCQMAGIAAMVCRLPQGEDPDSFLMHKGAGVLGELLDQSEDYLTFLISQKMRVYPNFSPREKALVIEETITQIKKWGNPIVVYEHLKQLASLMMIPESMVFSLAKLESGIAPAKSSVVNKERLPKIHSDVIIETDVLRCMLFCKTHHTSIPHTAKNYFTAMDFKHPECRKLFSHLIEYYEKHQRNLPFDEALSLLEDKVIIELLIKRRMNTDCLETVFVQSLQKLADRQWKEQRHPLSRQSKSAREETLSILEDYVRLRKDRVIVTLLEPQEC